MATKLPVRAYWKPVTRMFLQSLRKPGRAYDDDRRMADAAALSLVVEAPA